MQLNMGGLRLNTLFLYFLFHHLYLYFLFFFFNFPSFCSLYFFFLYSFFFYFLVLPMFIHTGLSWCHKFQLRFMSIMPQIKGTFIKIERFKMKHGHLKRRWNEFVGAISHNTSFTHCPVLNLILAWVSLPIFRLQHCCRFRKRMQLNMGGLPLNNLFLYYLFNHLFLTSFSFSSISLPSAVYISSFSFFFYFLLQRMFILTSLLWCHKSQLHFMSPTPQIRGTFIKIEHFKMKSCPSQKKIRRVRGSNIT